MLHLLNVILIVVDLALIAAVIVLAIKLQRLNAFVSGVAASKPGITSAARVREWKSKMVKYPEGSPKHTAYKNRLRELGQIGD